MEDERTGGEDVGQTADGRGGGALLAAGSAGWERSLEPCVCSLVRVAFAHYVGAFVVCWSSSAFKGLEEAGHLAGGAGSVLGDQGVVFGLTELGEELASLLHERGLRLVLEESLVAA